MSDVNLISSSSFQPLSFSLQPQNTDDDDPKKKTESKKSDVKNKKPFFRPIALFGFSYGLGGNSQNNHISFTVPVDHIPQPKYLVPGKNKLNADGWDGMFGINVSMLSMLEVGVDLRWNAPVPDGTYWGGYGVGQYACIGKVYNKSRFMYNAKLRTPEIYLGETENLGETFVQPYVSISTQPSKLYYESGYHKYGTAYYDGPVERFQIGTINSTPISFGLTFGNHPDIDKNGETRYSITIFAQKNIENIQLNDNGSDFIVEKHNRPSFGIRIDLGANFFLRNKK